MSALGIDEQRLRAILDFEAVDTTVLGHDYRVYAEITTWRADDVLRVPLSALFRQGKDWAVYVAKNGRALRRTVEIGHRNAEVAEYCAGSMPTSRSSCIRAIDIDYRSRIAPRSE